MNPTPSSESLKARLLEDPSTAQLAEQLGVPLNEYIQQVLHFMQHPGEEPQLLVVEDEDLRSAGYSVPAEEAMARFLEQAAAEANRAERTDFSQEKPRLVQLLGDVPPAPGAAPRTERAELETEVEARRRDGHLHGAC